MTTWKLWNALQRPFTVHPLYRWARGRPNAPYNLPLLHAWKPRSKALRVALGTLAIFGGILLALPALMLFIYFIFFAAPFVVPLVNNVYCALYAAGASSMLAEEREHKRYDVLAVCPIGALGTHWSVCAAWLQRSRTYHLMHHASWYFSFCVGAIGIAALLLFVVRPGYDTVVAGLVLALAALFYPDHVQSALVATMVAITVPIYATTRPNAQAWAIALYTLLQLGVYMLALVVGLGIVPLLLALWGYSGLVGTLLLPFFCAGLVYLFREGLITLMWYLLAWRLNADPRDLRELSLTSTWQYSDLYAVPTPHPLTPSPTRREGE